MKNIIEMFPKFETMIKICQKDPSPRNKHRLSLIFEELEHAMTKDGIKHVSGEKDN